MLMRFFHDFSVFEQIRMPLTEKDHCRYNTVEHCIITGRASTSLYFEDKSYGSNCFLEWKPEIYIR